MKEKTTGQSMAEAYNNNVRSKSFSKTARVIVALALGLNAVLAGILIGGVVITQTPDVSGPSLEPLPAANISVDDSDFTTTYNRTMPSVVSIYANQNAGGGSQGSGFVYNTEGYIVTNNHVIQSTDTIYVRYSQGEWSKATVVGTDPYTDLAVLSPNTRPEYARPLRVTSQLPNPGQRVMALGTPDNLKGTITTGVVSGVNRSMSTPKGYVIPDIIQTDASLNPGNSGGPLITTDGTVVGVNRARQGENIGFAVSGRLVNSIVPSLIETGSHTHSLVGVRSMQMSPTVAEANDIELREGLLITSVMEDGPSAGVFQDGGNSTITYKGDEIAEGGDIIVAIGDQSVSTNEELTSYLMRETTAGDTVEFEIIRDGERKTVTVTLGERPEFNG